jgi:hypothetical protein
VPTNSIAKQSGTTFPALINAPNAEGIIADSADGFIKYDDGGSVRTIVNVEETQTVSGNKTFSGTSTFSGATSFTGATTIAGLGLVQAATVALTNAEFLAIRATPKQLVAAPGAGFVLEFLEGLITIDYTAAYTESADNLAVRYTNTTGVIVSTIETTGFVDATADSAMSMVALPPTTAPLAINAALVLHGTGDGEFGGGNAANVITVTTRYRITAVP